MTPSQANTLPKEQRLHGKTKISKLISSGKWGSTEHLKYCWLKNSEACPTRIMVSLSKKFFKRAVKRNLLKRRIREAYRTQKDLLPELCGINILFSYSCKDVLDYSIIRTEVAEILSRLSKKL